MARGCEVGSITDGKQDLCCGLDTDFRHTRFKASEAGKSSSMLSTWPAIGSRRLAGFAWAGPIFNSQDVAGGAALKSRWGIEPINCHEAGKKEGG